MSSSEGVCPICQKQMGTETEDTVKIGKKGVKVLKMPVFKGYRHYCNSWNVCTQALLYELNPQKRHWET